MAIKTRKVKNKKDENGTLTGKPGTVYDVYFNISTADGTKSYGKRGFVSRQAAQQHESEMRAQIVSPLYIPVKAVDEKRTVKEYLESWIETHGEVNLRPSTKDSYKSTIKIHIVPYIGNLQLSQLTPETLDKLFSVLLQKGLSTATVLYAQRVLSVSLEAARKYGYIKTNPAKDTITRLRPSPVVPDPYTIAQMQQLFGHALGREWQMRVILAGFYGLRRNEVLGLRWQNVDLEKRRMLISEQLPFKLNTKDPYIHEFAPPKSYVRELPITEMTLPYFREHLSLSEKQRFLAEKSGAPFYDNDLVISRPDGRFVSPPNMSSDFASFLRSTGMPHIRFHDLRHTTATNMHQLTGDFFTVSQILGHTLKGIGIELGISGSLDSVTSQYVDVRIERKEEVLSAYHNAVLPKVLNQDKTQRDSDWERDRGGRDERER